MTTKNAPGDVHPSHCWEWYDAQDGACKICMVATRCADATKRKNAGVPPEPPVECDAQAEADEPLPAPSPFEYLREKMVLEYDVSMSETDTAVSHDYRNKAGGLVLRLMVGKNGNAQAQSAKGCLDFEAIKDNRQIDEILTKLL